MIKVEYSADCYTFDQKIECKILNLKSKDLVVVKTKIKDEHGKLWESEIESIQDSSYFEFNTDDIILSTEYKKVYGKTFLNNIPTKLFEYLNKKNISATHYIPKFIKLSDKSIIFEIEISVNDVIIDNRKLKYKTYNNSIKTLNIKDKFIGKYYYNNAENRPTIIILGGSMGDFNWSEQYAAVLSNKGFNTLAVSYFSFRGLNKLPKSLLEIDINYFEHVINWIRKKSSKSPIGIIGLSKGAELSLLLGSKFKDQIKSIIAISPSSHCFEGVYLGKNKGISSWSEFNKEINFIKYPDKTNFTMLMEPGYLYDIHDRALKRTSKNELEKARIKVERITCPTLLITGNEDLTWPSKTMVEDIVNRNNSFLWINYPKVGHIFNIPNIYPLLESNQHYYKYAYHANNDLWEQTCNFLNINLTK